MSGLERAARALCERDIRIKRKWDTEADALEAMLPGAVNVHWPNYVAEARTVIEAIREPDQGMTLAGEDAAWDAGNCMPAIRAVPKMWGAMIDTLLTPTPNPQRAKDAGGRP